MNHQEALTSYIAAFVAELVKSGVEDVVVSPGSRSTPMAMVMAEHPELRVHIHVDERSAAFFALGLAKASKKPAALLCTSGTAAANYYPAIVEARYSRVPLIVLTADRPHELRDVGAPQAIDQIHLYGNNVKWFVEMAPPEKSEEMLRYARAVCARAASAAMSSPAGPVHLNFPFREPLVPHLDRADLFELSERTEGYVNIQGGKLSLPIEEYKELAEVLNSAKRGIIICGQLEKSGFPDAVIRLAEKLNFPVIADPLSQLRSGHHDGSFIIDTYDTFLKIDDAKKALKPDVIIRFGAMPVSKPLSIFMKENSSARQIIVDGGGGWRDPALISTEMIHCDELQFCESVFPYLITPNNDEFFALWKKINDLTRLKLADIKQVEQLSEGKLFYQLAEILPEGSTLFVGNSMPIRDLDTFFHVNQKGIRVMANRGANGIDGTVSTALGAGMSSKPLYLVLGDLTFFHDLNGLIASKQYGIDINILLINNNGGGIFSFLPQANFPNNFEKLFGTPLDLDFSHAIKMFGGEYDLITDWEHFLSAFKRNLDRPGLKVMEITTNRERNLTEHRELWNSVSREISRLLEG
ncbi:MULTISPECIES: 2-succinyl-5-enolpyruvyl-6-hydroxy-3-cyclohexene-1-carboxylic-acid synthase [unclassified Cytobacillus]|uniref:2-succinyl-5-enolpyruvyl-6-hydroxy-3- cyclohexene-1-carboxylic-acid synthase n=1 Tax=unclassified Cytobacillus TaxID=2675268 RepID=UPI00135C3EEF|nr:2-succinyl-5-enolpyruvyl-6-hydroxy-3-cyclohexene-1-carboxylic-acid synthase [Cytobacillus sp. AMY 15.2]KAF0816385.1 2-succinyl-5-enolpyruvyl-6-hydroxy-3- cyclohexene-1-carboxylic-acid synthase [Bacillus sp. ZZV12-4809]MCM3093534.1 2-succinyl-5-enolpyruvyl-6-hydroxy-3-cyclohexene-1-carboxylic-acid synthase [Cytobacillus sp. AMY 15.2]